MRYLFIGLVFFTASIFMSGCASGPRVVADMLIKKNVVKGMHSEIAFIGETDTNKHSGYQNSDNIEYKCSTQFTIHAFATKAIENGYPFFTMQFPKGSNSNPISVVTRKQIDQYCTPTYYDKESSLLDDKCSHIGLGQGTPSVIRNVKARFYKKRNPFIPMWDAKKTISDTTNELINTCWNGDSVAFRKAAQSYSDFGRKEIE